MERSALDFSANGRELYKEINIRRASELSSLIWETIPWSLLARKGNLCLGVHVT